LGQHFKADDLRWAVAKEEKRKREVGLETVFIVKDSQLEPDRLESFKKRKQDKASPTARKLSTLFSKGALMTDRRSSATPQGVEYFTPCGGAGLTPGSDNNPPGWSPMSRAPTFQGILENSKINETFTAQIMNYDQGAEPVTIVEVIRQRYESADADEQSLKHEFHQCGMLAVIGRGRFSKRQKAAQLLWQARNMAMAMQSRIYEPQSFPSRSSLSLQTADMHVPQFWICSRSDESLKSNIQTIIGFVKHNNVFRNLLGLTRPDAAHWMNDWLQMSNSDGLLVESVANHLFGDTLLSYPKMSILNILIKFHTTLPTKKPVLLRISIGRDPRLDILDCPHCDKTFQLIDYIGPQGAAKLHVCPREVARPPATCAHPFRDWADFSSDHTTKRRTVHTKWSQIAYLYQGWSDAPLLVRCTCEDKIHKNLKSEHFINLWDEKLCKEDNELFDETGESRRDIMDAFEPYPQEYSQVLYIGSHGKAEDSEEEDQWDPNGDAGSEDEKVFDPFPPEEHAEKFLSAPVRLHGGRIVDDLGQPV
jgi:hypothetical protein